ncbi:MAG TPA: AraC family transcriptional regulator [Candidatus Elarobacter sp.]|jgi:AraC-like DNA-binding protein|nr:AraC family transcriptional regulator [Candidatus Elarobacter sp.]
MRAAADRDVRLETHESALGRYRFVHWVPGADDELCGTVERIWYFEGTLTHARERTFPNGCCEIVVQLDRPHRPVAPVAGDPFPPVCMAGLLRTSAVIEAPAGFTRVLGLTLHPATIWTLLRALPAELLDRTVALDELAGRAARELGERCGDARGGEACVHSAAAWVSARLRAAAVPDARIAWSVAALRSDAETSVALLHRTANLGASRFTDLFRERVGISPKRYARIVRFNRALRALNRGAAASAVAAADGYADQSHFGAEFRAHAGMTPGQYTRALRYGEGSLAEPVTGDFS